MNCSACGGKSGGFGCPNPLEHLASAQYTGSACPVCGAKVGEQCKDVLGRPRSVEHSQRSEED